MAVEFPTYETGRPQPVLGAFIISTRDFLAELVENTTYPTGQSLFYNELLSELRAAWKESQPMFALVANETSRLGDGAINDHGLIGAQLRFKLSVVRFLHNRYLTVPGIGRLRRLIESIDTLLESILGAVGVGEGIKEIKEYFEHSLAE